MADERLPWRRSESIVETRSDNVMSRPPAISFSPLQNASSRLTLVLWPAMTIERLTTGDFIYPLPYRSGVDRDRAEFWPFVSSQVYVALWTVRVEGASPQHAYSCLRVRPSCGQSED